MPPYGFADGSPTFRSFAELVASGYRGVATVDGVVYAWSDEAGRPIAQRTAGKRYIANLLGDSHIEGNGVGSVVHGLVYFGGDVYLLGKNGGVGGQTSSQVLSRIYSYLDCDVLFIGFGQNNGPVDTIGSTQMVSALADMRSAINICKSCGVEPVIVLPPTSNTANLASWLSEYKAALCYMADKMRVRVYNACDGAIDEATGGYLSGKSSDGKHLTFDAANSLSAATYSEFLARSKRVPSVSTSPDLSGHLINNALMLTDSNSDGRADGWYAPGGTCNIVSDSAIIGRWQRITFSASGQYISYTLSSNPIVGHKYYWCMRGEWGDLGGNSIQTKLVAQSGQLLNGNQAVGGGIPSIFRGSGSGLLDGSGVIPANAATYWFLGIFSVGSSATGWLKIAQPIVIDLTALGLDDL